MDMEWREHDGVELFFIDDENFVFTCCQTCGAWITKSTVTEELHPQCEHAEER